MDNRHRSPWSTGLLVITLSSGLVCTLSSDSLAQEGITIEKVFQVWKSRHERAQTVQFVWVDRRTYAKDSMFSMAVPAKPAPREDLTLEQELTLSLDGDLMRFTRGYSWHANEARFVPRTYISVFDGKDDKCYESESADGAHGVGLHKLGFIRRTALREEKGGDVADYHLWPVLLTYRALHSEMGRFQLNEWTMTGEKGVVQGRECVILKKKPHQGITETCWVDVERECAIARYEITVHGNLLLRIDVTSKQDPSYGWLPFSWRITKLFPETSKLAESSVARVTENNIGMPLQPHLFRLDFPPGTVVWDDKEGINYVALKAGDRRIITKEERRCGATYEQLLATESGMAGLPPERTLRRFWVVTSTILILISLLTGFVVWWKRARFKKLA
jgi:hypothetical protein